MINSGNGYRLSPTLKKAATHIYSIYVYGGRKVDFRIVYFSVIWKYTYTILFLPYELTRALLARSLAVGWTLYHHWRVRVNNDLHIIIILYELALIWSAMRAVQHSFDWNWFLLPYLVVACPFVETCSCRLLLKRNRCKNIVTFPHKHEFKVCNFEEAVEHG